MEMPTCACEWDIGERPREERERERERVSICINCPREAGNRTRLMFYDRQKPATLFNVAPIRALPVLASHSSIL